MLFCNKNYVGSIAQKSGVGFPKRHIYETDRVHVSRKQGGRMVRTKEVVLQRFSKTLKAFNCLFRVYIFLRFTHVYRNATRFLFDHATALGHAYNLCS